MNAQTGCVNMRIVNTAKINPFDITPVASIVLTSKGGETALPAGMGITASLSVTKGMSVWEITPTNMPRGYDPNLAMTHLPKLSSALTRLESTVLKIEPK